MNFYLLDTRVTFSFPFFPLTLLFRIDLARYESIDAETRFPQNMLGTEKAKAFPLAARVPFCVPRRSGCLPSKNLADRNSAKYAGFPF